MNNLEDLPVAAFTNLAEFLSHNDLLQLRGVSKKVQQNVNFVSFQLEQRLKRQCILFRTFSHFKQFVSSVMFSPYSNFSFVFNPLDHLDSSEMDCFLLRFGKTLHKLSLPHVHLFMCEKEVKFFEKLPRLYELISSRVRLWKSGYSLILNDSVAYQNALLGIGPIGNPIIPRSFANIKIFQFDIVCDGPLLLMFIRALTNLKILRMGDLDRNHVFNDLTEPQKENIELLNLQKYIDYRSAVNLKNNLELISLSSGLEDAEDIDNVVLSAFAKAVIKHKVKIQNVPDTVLVNILDCFELSNMEKKSFFNLVTQLEEFRPSLSRESLKNLQSFHFSSGPSYIESFNINFGNPNGADWCRIEYVSISIQMTQDRFEDLLDNIQGIWNFVFGCQRPTLEVLHIQSNLELENAKLIMNPLFLAHNFCSLKSLNLDLPYYMREDYCILLHEIAVNIHGLSYLDLTIRCDVSNDIFIGPDIERPTMLRMKELKHLRISHRLSATLSSAKQPVEVNALDFMRDILPKVPLTCLRLNILCLNSMFYKTPVRARAILDGVIGTTLRSLNWNSDATEDMAVYSALNEKISQNKSNVISIFNRGRRCKICENYEKDNTLAEKWFDFPQIH